MSSQPGEIIRLLQRVHRLDRLADASRMGWLALALCVTAGLALVVIDALYGLNRFGLVVLDLIWLGALAAAGWAVAGRWAAHRYRPEQVAVELQRKLGVSHGALINALQLAGQEQSGVSEALRAYAVRLGEELAGTVRPEDAVEKAGLRRARRFAVISVLAFVLLYAVWPRLFNTILPRLANPFGEHPPFTLLRFDVAVLPEPLYFGYAADLEVVITGPRLPAQAEVVFIEQDGSRSRVPLWAAPTDPAGKPVRAGFSLLPRQTGRYSLHIDRAEISRMFYIDTPKGRSATFPFEVLPVPLFEGVEVEYRFPEYTGWPVQRTRLKDSTIKAIRGTTVQLTVDSNIALREGSLDVEPDNGDEPFAVQLNPDSERPARVSGDWVLDRSGAYSLGLTGADGTPGLEAWEGLLTALEDRPPEVQIEHPMPVIVAPENWVIESVVGAEDDVAVEEGVFYARVNEGAYLEQAIDPDPHRKNLRRLRQVQPIDLAALGAKPGDTVQYFASARDNAPEHAQVGESRIGSIVVMSMEDYKDLARSQYGARELMEELAETLAALDELRARRDALLDELEQLREELAEAGAQPNAEQVQRLAALRQALDQYAREAAELAETLEERAAQEELYDFEEPYKEWLKETARQLARQQKDAESLLDAWHPDPGRAPWNPAMDSAMAVFKKNDDPFSARRQQDGLAMEEDLESMQLAGDMLVQMARLRQVIEGQRDLADRMNVLRTMEQGDPDVARRLEGYASEQDELGVELTDLLEKLSEAAEAAAEKLPKMSASAQQFNQAVKDLDVESDQYWSSRHALRGEGLRAAALADAAADKLESLYSACQNMGNQACQDLDGALSLSREQCMNALKQMIQAGMKPGMNMGNTGQSGAGFGGMMASFGMVGPSFPMRGESMMMRSMKGKNGKSGKASGSDEETGEGPERIQPEFSYRQNRHVGAMPGVPIRYRELAEAYFKRIAEDSTGVQRPTSNAQRPTPNAQPEH